MQINKIGEFGLIERFRRRIKTGRSVIVGSGDDCAVLDFNKHSFQLFTCDMLVAGVDFLAKEDLRLVGRKAVAVSISDIASCGGLPRHCLVSLGIPVKTCVESLDKLFNGMYEMAKKYKINIVGGDISRAKQLVIDVSMLGEVEKRNLVLRKGAREGDIIFVSGALGGSISGKHLRFSPRLKEARFLVNNFRVNSMIDISDGLAQDLYHILKINKVGAILFEPEIPLSKEAAGLNDALFSGEDFELLFTMSVKEAKRLLNRKAFNFKPIGEITGGSGLRLIDKNNKVRILEPAGFRHF